MDLRAFAPFVSFVATGNRRRRRLLDTKCAKSLPLMTLNLARYQSRVQLRDGAVLRLRAIIPEDADKLLDLYHRLSPRSLYQRFFTIPKPDPAYAAYLANVDYETHFALVAEVAAKIIAVARYHRTAVTSRAEAAFTVADAWQGRGLGPLLLDRLAQVALAHNIESFEAELLTDNQQMMKVLSRSRFEMKPKVKAGVYRISLALAP